MPKTRGANPNDAQPLDRLIRLIAEIEVAKYMEEIKIMSVRKGSDHHESSNIRPIQR